MSRERWLALSSHLDRFLELDDTERERELARFLRSPERRHGGLGDRRVVDFAVLAKHELELGGGRLEEVQERGRHLPLFV